MSLGRPPIKGRMTTTYSILFPDADFLPKLDEIAKSQSTSRRKYIISVLQKAIDDHEKEGQTGLQDFTEGAPVTDNLEFMRVTHLLQREKEVSRLDILDKFRQAGFEHPKLMAFTQKAEKYLEEKGVKIWGG